VSKILFIPFSVLGGILARAVAQKAFDALWGVLDNEDAPDPKYREISLKKLIPALLIEGAIFRIVRGLLDHGARHAFNRMTGNWPGEERPEPA
jgi:hypothetical protein